MHTDQPLRPESASIPSGTAPHEQRGKRIAHNFLWVTLARLFDIISSIITVALTARYLGVQDFGTYSYYMAIAWISYPFLIMGLPKILIRDIARDRSQAGVLIGGAISVVLCFAIIILAGVIGWQSLAGSGQDVQVMVIIGLALAASAMTRILGAIYMACEQTHFELKISFSSSFVFVASTIAVIMLKLGIIWLFIGFLAANIIGMFMALDIALRVFHVKPVFRLTRSNARYLIAESLPMVVAQVLMQSNIYSGVFFLKTYGTINDLGLFQAPFRIITRMQIIPLNTVIALSPLLSQLFITDRDQLRSVQKLIFKGLFTVALLLSVAGVSLSDEIVRLMFGKAFADAAPLFRIQMLALALFFLNTSIECFYVSANLQRRLVVVFGIGLATSLVGNQLLVPSQGAYGASLVILVSQVALFISGISLFADIFSWRDAVTAISRPLPALAAVGAAFYLTSIMNHVGAAVISMALCIVLLMATRSLTHAEVAYFRSLRSKRKSTILEHNQH